MRSLLIASALLAGLTLTGASASAQLRAGAGKADIKTSPDMWPIDGFTSQHDPLMVRTLMVGDGPSVAAIVVIDQTSISDASINKIKSAVQKLANVLPQNTLVIASHTFSAPHVFGGAPGGGPGGPGSGPGGAGGPGVGPSGVAGNRPGVPPAEQSIGTVVFSKAIDEAVESATRKAMASLQPAMIGFAIGSSDVSVNRDVKTPKGWWLGADPSSFSDRALPVVRIDAMDGKPIAVLINAAVQSSVMDHSETKDGGKPVTADVTGAATRFVEEQFGGDTVALFLIGAAGDQAPIFQGNRYVLGRDGTTTRVDIHEAGFMLVDLIGERLGSEAMAAARAISTARASTVQVVRKTIEVSSQASARGLPTEPVLRYDFESGPRIQVPVVLVRIGDVAIVGLQAELAGSVGAQIKAGSPFPHTLVVTMVDGGAKYMPDAQSYDRFTYEARNSRYAKGAAEAVATGVKDLLSQLMSGTAAK